MQMIVPELSSNYTDDGSSKCKPKKEKGIKDSKRKREEQLKIIDGAESFKKIAIESVGSELENNIIVPDQHIDDYRSIAKHEESEIPSHLRIESHGLSESTIESLKARGVRQLFPIQAASIGPILEGKDLLGRARTGTGKTLAFSLPMVEILKRLKLKNSETFSKRGRAPKILIMAPTRELAMQVHKEFDSISSGELISTCIYGGTQYDGQYYALKEGLDVVVGTPGRLIDHIEQGTLKLHALLFLCMDEADQMLDIGYILSYFRFAEDMAKILDIVTDQKRAIENSPSHQTLLFSATMPAWIKEAVRIYMRPDKVTLDLIGTDKQKTSVNFLRLIKGYRQTLLSSFTLAKS
jgi:ATP-dependent RNA helicase DDX21